MLHMCLHARISAICIRKKQKVLHAIASSVVL
jgi:hypothetical protein